MDFSKLLEKLPKEDFSIGLGGCKNHEKGFSCCEYNLTIFDSKNEFDSVDKIESELVKIHHGSLEETRSEILVQFDQMKILYDDRWELRMFLSKINERREKIFQDAAKGVLVDALFCISKSKEALKNSDPFATIWQKCGAYYIADAISIINGVRPSPTHMLNDLRGLKQNSINETLSVVTDSIGIERATPSLLSRMAKSTTGFSEMVEKNNHSKIIQAKYDYLVENSLLSDCYFYLGYVNKQNVIRIKDTISKRPDLIHVLKVAMDLENDPAKSIGQSDLLHQAANLLLEKINN